MIYFEIPLGPPFSKGEVEEGSFFKRGRGRRELFKGGSGEGNFFKRGRGRREVFKGGRVMDWDLFV